MSKLMDGDVVLASVTKRYGDVIALDNVSLRVSRGSVLAVLGPSGSGKSTLLQICAGVTEPTSGKVLVGEDDITSRPANERYMGVVFQSYALFPHMTVLHNVAFPLRTRRYAVPKKVAYQRAAEMLDMVGLRGLDFRMPADLSGGQQQRVALARALVYHPPVLLLDEPLGALDRSLREQLLDDILRLRQELALTILYVTHDQREAMVIADTMAVFRDGRVEQVGACRHVYERPANEFVARFVSEANLIEGCVRATSAGQSVIGTGVGIIRAEAEPGIGVGSAVLIAVRPEAITIGKPAPEPQMGNRLIGRATRVSYRGSRVLVGVAIGSVTIKVSCSSRVADEVVRVGEEVQLRWAVADTRIMRTGIPASESAPVMAVAEDSIQESSKRTEVIG